ncbi:hypothetical protein GJ698_05720 [Pseudoduganella sp. FT26W]|jgi:hypothetical protein|uniref:DUF2782 domain-containing protein n=1 Tax=Duganella aquatilis TaxID=2666082 RepID=A0A844D7T1_9BURK|nr:hypothetical protein [Duganella aquatilis]MRW83590.1 hypothetical protein [Duganella aquatilis]
MTRTSLLWPALLLTLGAHTAFAQSTPSQAPPKLEKLEEVTDDGVTITAKPAENKITEKRDNSGNVTEATVKSGPSTYTLRPNHPAGTAMPGDAMSGNLRGAQWTVMEFDLGKKKKKSVEEEAEQEFNTPPQSPPAK